jgi:hypothetical protein
MFPRWKKGNIFERSIYGGKQMKLIIEVERNEKGFFLKSFYGDHNHPDAAYKNTKSIDELNQFSNQVIKEWSKTVF